MTQKSAPLGSARTTKSASWGYSQSTRLAPKERRRSTSASLFLFGVNPEVEVCPVVLIEMDTRSLFLSRNQERGVVRLLAVVESTCPEGTGLPDVLDVHDHCSDAQHPFRLARRRFLG